MCSTSRGNMYNISKAIMCSTSKAIMYSTNLLLSTSCSTPTASIILHRSSVKARRWSSNNNSNSNKRSIRETTTWTPITRGTTTWRRTNRETTTTWRSLATKWKGTMRLVTEVTMTSVGSSTTTTTTSTISTMIGEVE